MSGKINQEIKAIQDYCEHPKGHYLAINASGELVLRSDDPDNYQPRKTVTVLVAAKGCPGMEVDLACENIDPDCLTKITKKATLVLSSASISDLQKIDKTSRARGYVHFDLSDFELPSDIEVIHDKEIDEEYVDPPTTEQQHFPRSPSGLGKFKEAVKNSVDKIGNVFKNAFTSKSRLESDSDLREPSRPTTSNQGASADAARSEFLDSGFEEPVVPMTRMAYSGHLATLRDSLKKLDQVQAILRSATSQATSHIESLKSIIKKFEENPPKDLLELSAFLDDTRATFDPILNIMKEELNAVRRAALDQPELLREIRMVAETLKLSSAKACAQDMDFATYERYMNRAQNVRGVEAPSPESAMIALKDAITIRLLELEETLGGRLIHMKTTIENSVTSLRVPNDKLVFFWENDTLQTRAHTLKKLTTKLVHIPTGAETGIYCEEKSKEEIEQLLSYLKEGSFSLTSTHCASQEKAALLETIQNLSVHPKS